MDQQEFKKLVFMNKKNINLFFITVLAVVLIYFLEFIVISGQATLSHKVLGLGTGFLAGFYFEILAIKDDRTERQIWNYLMFVIFAPVLIIILILSKIMLWGHIIGFTISYAFCYYLKSYIKDHQ